MSALAQSSQFNTSNDSVTSISVNARIDYILRFSKHAILVVDESAQECSSVGYQFLDQLSSEHNAAFVSTSAKLNNIQIRCRIIEQLFSGNVFDPEQSLAVSIVNLLNANPQKLAIVIDNVQFASLQIIHELTQLALIAKKAQLAIEVLMLGNYNAGKIIAEHKDLFHKKISVLSKHSGQLLSLSAKEFKTPQSWFTLTVSKKWLIALMGISLMAVMTVIWLQQQDKFSFSKLAVSIPEASSTDDNSEKTVLPLLFDKIGTNLAASKNKTPSDKLAPATYIYDVLVGNVVVKKVIDNIPAKVSDIVSAIAAFQDPVMNKSNVVSAGDNSTAMNVLPLSTTIPSKSDVDKKSTISTEEKLAGPENTNNMTLMVTPMAKEITLKDTLQPQTRSTIKLGNNYYKNFTKGFVIQISGFTQDSIMQEFLADFPNIEFKRYQRLLNDEIMTVLTSKHYVSHAEAEQAMAALPGTILAREPWIKSISAINSEINAFERSQ